MPSILGANTLSGGFEVANSLRFNDGDSPSLTRSLGTTTLATKGTFSFWVKRGQLGTAQIIYSNEVADDNNCLLYTSPSPRDRTRSRMPSSA